MKIFINQSKAEVLRMFRNPYFIFWSLLMPIVFYFITTKIFLQNLPDLDLWEAHVLMSMTSFSVMGSSIMTLGITLVQERKEGWTKYLQVTPLPNAVYFTAKMVGQSLVHIFSITLIFTIGGLINSVSLSLVEWFLSGLWILFGSMTFLALGTLFGAMKKIETATGVSNFVYMLLAITGGMWMPMESMPNFIQKVGSWLPAFNYGNGAWQIVRGNMPEFRNIAILAIYLIVFMVISIYIRRKQEAIQLR